MKRNGEITATTNIHTYIIHIYMHTHKYNGSQKEKKIQNEKMINNFTELKNNMCP